MISQESRRMAGILLIVPDRVSVFASPIQVVRFKFSFADIFSPPFPVPAHVP
jgi:hypothetical protein